MIAEIEKNFNRIERWILEYHQGNRPKDKEIENTE